MSTEWHHSLAHIVQGMHACSHSFVKLLTSFTHAIAHVQVFTWNSYGNACVQLGQILLSCMRQYVCETSICAKRDLPHTSNSMNLEDCNLCFKEQISLKIFPSINLQYIGTHCKFQGNGPFIPEIMNCQS